MKITLCSILFEEPEPGKDALFGKYMFDDQRKDIKKNNKEEPTPEEEEAFEALARYASFNDKSDLSKIAPSLFSLKQKNMYSAMLDPFKGDRINVYRLLFLDAETGKSTFNIDLSKPTGKLPAGVIEPTMNSEIQGWTTDPSMFPTIIKTESSERKPVYVILKASLKKNNNFFGNPNRLVGTADEDFKHEKETFSIGSVKYDKGIYFIADPNKPDEIKSKLLLAILEIKK
jgi:hypothetical protein